MEAVQEGLIIKPAGCHTPLAFVSHPLRPIGKRILRRHNTAEGTHRDSANRLCYKTQNMATLSMRLALGGGLLIADDDHAELESC